MLSDTLDQPSISISIYTQPTLGWHSMSMSTDTQSTVTQHSFNCWSIVKLLVESQPCVHRLIIIMYQLILSNTSAKTSRLLTNVTVDRDVDQVSTKGSFKYWVWRSRKVSGFQLKVLINTRRWYLYHTHLRKNKKIALLKMFSWTCFMALWQVLQHAGADIFKRVQKPWKW